MYRLPGQVPASALPSASSAPASLAAVDPTVNHVSPPSVPDMLARACALVRKG